jgi:hypothetical protein
MGVGTDRRQVWRSVVHAEFTDVIVGAHGASIAHANDGACAAHITCDGLMPNATVGRSTPSTAVGKVGSLW